MNVRFSKNLPVLLSLALIVFATLDPYFFWGKQFLFYALFLFFFLLSMVFSFDVLDKGKIHISFLLFVIMFIYMRMVGGSVLGAFYFSLIMMITFLLKSEYIIILFEKFKIIFAVILIPAIFLWVFHHLYDNSFLYLGAIPDPIIPNQGKVESGQGYAHYPLAVVLDYMLDKQFYRLAGVFDEPGVVGTISALLLMADRFDMKNNINKVIFLAGLLSLSFAFYLLVVLYIVLANLNSKKIFFVFLFFVVVFFILSSNETLSEYTIDRFQIVDGRISGDNRSADAVENLFNQWKSASFSSVLFGLGVYESYGSSTIKLLFIRAGVLGFALLLLVYILSYLKVDKSKGYNEYVFLFLFFLSAYQRPQIVAPAFFLIFLAGIIIRHQYSNVELKKT